MDFLYAILSFKCRGGTSYFWGTFWWVVCKGKNHLGVYENSDFHISGLLQAARICLWQAGENQQVLLWGLEWNLMCILKYKLHLHMVRSMLWWWKANLCFLARFPLYNSLKKHYKTDVLITMCKLQKEKKITHNFSFSLWWYPYFSEFISPQLV